MFRFKNFALSHENSTLKIGTDSVLLASIPCTEKVSSILDIGCGCGVIAFCLADTMKSEKNERYILGIDIDNSSIKEAIGNLKLFPQYRGQTIEFHKESLQQFSKNTQSCFDLIISNPPFFSSSLKPNSSSLCKSKHRDQNLSFHELVECVSKLLQNDGKFYLILPVNESKEFEDICKERLFLHMQWNIFPVKGKKANRKISCYTLYKKENIGYYDIYIRNEQHQYTQEYRTLTEYFYLSLK